MRDLDSIIALNAQHTAEQTRVARTTGDVRPESIDVREWPFSAQPHFVSGVKRWQVLNLTARWDAQQRVATGMAIDDAFALAHEKNAEYWRERGVTTEVAS